MASQYNARVKTPQTDAWLLKYSGEHLLHEIKMFRWLAGNIKPMGTYEYENDAMVESFVLHLRNLIMFFCFPESNGDDVVAGDFCHDPSKWPATESTVLKDARLRANKELSHLTSVRKNKGDPDKEWNVASLVGEIDSLAKRFAANASPKKLSPDVIELINAPDSGLMAVLGKHAAMSNVASNTMTYGSTPAKSIST